MSQRNRGFGVIAFVIAIAVVAAIGGGSYYKMKKPSAKVSSTASTTTFGANATTSVKAETKTTVSVGTLTTGSIRSLLEANKDLECTVEYSTSTPKGMLTTSGTVYVSGNMMRGDFTMTGTGATVNDAHLIRVGDELQVWSGKQGAKLTLSGFSTSASSNGEVSLDQSVNYKCVNWSKDASKFTAPSGITIYDTTNINLNNIKMPVVR